MPEEEIDRGEVEAVLETRRELGSTYDAALVDSFADRVEAAVAARAADEVEARRRADKARATAGPRQLALGIVSAVMAVPITAIAMNAGDSAVANVVGTVVSWAGLVGINAAHAVQSRGGR